MQTTDIGIVCLFIGAILSTWHLRKFKYFDLNTDLPRYEERVHYMLAEPVFLLLIQSIFVEGVIVRQTGYW